MTFSNKRIEAAHNRILAAEKSLNRRLMAGETRDLLQDNFTWLRDVDDARDLLEAIDLYGFDDWTPRAERSAYELYMNLRQGPKVVATFYADDDRDAWTKANESYDRLPSRNISVSYQCREKATGRDIMPPAETAAPAAQETDR